MDELIAFVKARLDEDEAAARAATPGEWAAIDGGVMSVEDDGQWPVSGTESVRDRADRVHIARHDPARVLREVEAKRRIVDDYRITANACRNVTGAEIDSPGYRAMCAGRDALKSCVTLLAAVWSDHQDYRSERAVS